jgi:hypothetical protein
MRTVLVVLIAAAIAVAASGPAGAVKIDRDFHETFDVKEGAHLELHFGDGDVTITPWERDAIDVTVVFRADVRQIAVGGPPDFEVEFKETGDRVKVVGRMLPTGPAIFRTMKIHEHTYTIKAPPYVVLEIEGDDGDVEITGWNGDISCALDDGDAVLTNVDNGRTSFAFDDGDLTATGLVTELHVAGDDGDVILSRCTLTTARVALEDGDLSAFDSEGTFSVSVDDGDVSLSLTRCESAHVSCSDGDVDISVVEGDVGEISVATDDGDVLVSMPDGSSYAFHITMDDGHVRIDVPDKEYYEREEHSAMGRVRGGSGRIRIRTNDGNVLLEES